jgi:hypothetical protein
VFLLTHAEALEAALRNEGLIATRVDERTLSIASDELDTLMRIAVKNHLSIEAIEPEGANLAEAFLALTGGAASIMTRVIRSELIKLAKTLRPTGCLVAPSHWWPLPFRSRWPSGRSSPPRRPGRNSTRWARERPYPASASRASACSSGLDISSSSVQLTSARTELVDLTERAGIGARARISLGRGTGLAELPKPPT